MNFILLKYLMVLLFTVSFSLVGAEAESVMTQLRAAVANNNCKLVSRLLDQNSNIDTNEKAADIDINERAVDGATLMHWASISGNQELLGLLRERRADFLVPDNNGDLPFHYACQYGNPEAVSWFLNLDRNIDFGINRQNAIGGDTPFMKSIHEIGQGDAEANEKLYDCQMMLLSDDRVDINIPNVKNMSPLWIALAWADPEGNIPSKLLQQSRLKLTPLVHHVNGFCMLKFVAEKSKPIGRELRNRRIKELILQDALNIVTAESISCIGRNETTGQKCRR